MSTANSRVRSMARRFGILLESLFIFILLLSGIGVVFFGKISGQLRFLLLPLGIGVEIIAIIIMGLYVYFRFLRRRVIETD